MRIKYASLAVVCCCLVTALNAEVAFVADYVFGWEPRPATARISSYWIFRRVPPAPIYNVVAVVGNTNSAIVSNVTTIIHYEWAVAPSNSLGLGELSEIVPTPANPGRVRYARPISIVLRVPPNAIIEQGPKLDAMTNRFLIRSLPNGGSLFAYRLEPGEDMSFWKWREMTNPILPHFPK